MRVVGVRCASTLRLAGARTDAVLVALDRSLILLVRPTRLGGILFVLALALGGDSGGDLWIQLF